MYHHRSLLVALIVALACAAVTLSGCAAPAPTPAPKAAASPSGPTFGQLATLGQAIYARSCTNCHGDKGQGVVGPALIGASAALDKYTTADGLWTKISTTMPQNSPGKLPPAEYQQVLSYLLIQNNWVPSDTVFDARALAKIPLKK